MRLPIVNRLKSQLLVAGVLGLLLVEQASAASCETTLLHIQGGNSNESKKISALSEITDAKLITTISLGKKTNCSSKKYFFKKNVFTTKKRCRGLFQLTGLKAGCSSSSSSSTIAQLPLFLSQQSKPNVMFVLDDSGSMQFELMPDDIIKSSARYIFPRPNDVYGGSDYSNIAPTFNRNDIYNMMTRSPQINRVYYNPGITYRPWPKHDTTLFPAAKPSCAYHNPAIPTKGCRNLTRTNTESAAWVGCRSSSSCGLQPSPTNRLDFYYAQSFWPSAYYWHNGGNIWSKGNYKRVEISAAQPIYSGQGREERDDCANAINGKCTYAEEIQNFANWYTYYRSRILASRGAIGAAFVQQEAGMRVGFGAINQGSNTVDGVSTTVIDTGVRDFEGSDKKAFFDNLYQRKLNAAGTPLRPALDKAGQYFSRRDNRGPWGAKPGTNDTTPHASCRRSYTVLMTDGYWTGGSSYAASSAASSDHDSTSGTTINGVNDQSYTFKPRFPYYDKRKSTLADTAMYYWKRDLRPDIPNNVSPLDRNPAFWQHMSVFGVGLGVSGSVSKKAAFDSIKTGAPVIWPNPDVGRTGCSGATCGARIDDLLHAGVNSHGGFFSTANPDAFSRELADVLQTISTESGSSASAIATNATRLNNGTLIFQARFDTRDWSGQLIASDLNTDGSIKSEVWNTNSVGKMPAASARNIITAVGRAGSLSQNAVAFTAGNWRNLSSEQRSRLQDGGSEQDGKDLLNWVRGDKSKEGSTFRSRSKTLGDIINSDPVVASATDDYGYRRLDGPEAKSYSTFLTDSTDGKAGRHPMLYVGANDGMLHAFNASSGTEVFAYLPIASYENLSYLANPNYQHRYYVDGSPAVGDAYIGNQWKTVLIGSTGAGGKAVFALDVTRPTNLTANEFLWEFSTASSDTHKLGVAMSDPVIARLKAGNKWVAIFGNGYNSGDTVKLMIVDLETGALLEAIDTKVSGIDNGLASVVPVDLNQDRITDVVYAGDLKGNLWKFDLSGKTSNQWDVAIRSAGKPAPLFTAVDINGTPQPITSRPVVGRHEVSGTMVYFGTGKYFQTGDAELPANPQIQDFYGIRDQGKQVLPNTLIQQTILYEGTTKLQNKVGDTSDDTDSNTPIRVVSNLSSGVPVSFGWRLKLLPPGVVKGQGERVVSRPLLRDGRIIFSSIIPNSDPCGYGGTGWLMEVDAHTGGRLSYSALDVNEDQLFSEGDYVKLNRVWVPVSGMGHKEMIKTPGIIGDGEKEYKYTSGSSGSVGVTREKGSSGRVGRQSWRQLM